MFLDRLNEALPVIHLILFVIGVSGNTALLAASITRTPPFLKAYSLMIIIGSFNDLVSVSADFFTQQRLLVVPGNLLYLSLGPCRLISARACYLGYCLQICTLSYSLIIVVASFAYRLWVLYHDAPSQKAIFLIMIALFIVPAAVGSSFTLAQADDAFVRQFIKDHAPKYPYHEGVLTGHTGFTAHLIFTIVFIIGIPWPLFVAILVLRQKILSKLREHSTVMSERTKAMHKDLVMALTIHSMFPPIYFVGVFMFLVTYFDICRHPALEKAIYTVGAVPTALSAFCTIYYVGPYRRFVG